MSNSLYALYGFAQVEVSFKLSLILLMVKIFLKKIVHFIVNYYNLMLHLASFNSNEIGPLLEISLIHTVFCNHSTFRLKR